MFFIAERLQKSVRHVERMSHREVMGWLAWFAEAQAANAPADDAVDLRSLTKEQKRGMFR